MLVMLRDGIQGVAASPRFTVISEVAEVFANGDSKLTPKKAAWLMYHSIQGRGSSNSAAKRARMGRDGTTPGSAAEGSQPGARFSPAAAQRDEAQRAIAFGAPRGRGAAQAAQPRQQQCQNRPTRRWQRHRSRRPSSRTST